MDFRIKLNRPISPKKKYIYIYIYTYIYRIYQKVRSILMVVIQDLIWNKNSSYTFSIFVPVSELREHNTYLASLDFAAILSLSSVVKCSCLVYCSVFPISSCFRLLLTSSKDEVVASEMFTNKQYRDMHFVCGFCNGNAAAAEREYRTPVCRIFLTKFSKLKKKLEYF